MTISVDELATKAMYLFSKNIEYRLTQCFMWGIYIAILVHIK